MYASCEAPVNDTNRLDSFMSEFRSGFETD